MLPDANFFLKPNQDEPFSHQVAANDSLADFTP
jgi:hypothetical protein